MKNVLALVDFSELTDKVIDTAGKIAGPMAAKCWIMHIAAPDPDFVGYKVGPKYVRDARAKELREEHRQLQALKDSLFHRDVDCEALLVQGDINETIIEEVNKLNIDLVILGSHGRSKLYELLIGSVTEFMLRNSGVPVLVVPVDK